MQIKKNRSRAKLATFNIADQSLAGHFESAAGYYWPAGRYLRSAVLVDLLESYLRWRGTALHGYRFIWLQLCSRVLHRRGVDRSLMKQGRNVGKLITFWHFTVHAALRRRCIGCSRLLHRSTTTMISL